MIDGQSYLLLICDEGGPPQIEFIHWVDAVVFVFVFVVLKMRKVLPQLVNII